MSLTLVKLFGRSAANPYSLRLYSVQWKFIPRAQSSQKVAGSTRLLFPVQKVTSAVLRKDKDHEGKSGTLIEHRAWTNNKEESRKEGGKWNWKLISLSGFLLATIAQQGRDWDLFSDWFTVHAAKPLPPDGNDYVGRGRVIGLAGSVDYGNNNSNSKRQQFNFIADVVDKAAKAVVCIQVKDHSMIDWFNGTPRTASNGSGFIIKEDGLILTNAHVVNDRGRTAIAVHLSDGRVYAGKIEAVDPVTDLALIRIQERGLPTLELANSSETRLGEWVVAIGSPLSLSNSVSAGVVSNVKRGANELGIRGDISYIQTDAAITFGNSGGPLVNLDGEAIGINTMKVAAGISFAIPSDYVKQFLTRTETRKREGTTKPFRRYIGLTFLTLTPDIVADLEQRLDSAPPTTGVFVWNVVVGSPAYVAGIQPGDVILKINDKDILTTKDVFEVMDVASDLKMLLIRNGRKYQCTIHPEDVPVQN